jgi:hypothetical protein
MCDSIALEGILDDEVVEHFDKRGDTLIHLMKSIPD